MFLLVDLHPMTHVGSRRMCLDPDVVPPLAGFLLYAILGVFHHVLSVLSVCILKTVFDLFICSRVTGSRVRTWMRVSWRRPSWRWSWSRGTWSTCRGAPFIRLLACTSVTWPFVPSSSPCHWCRIQVRTDLNLSGSFGSRVKGASMSKESTIYWGSCYTLWRTESYRPDGGWIYGYRSPCCSAVKRIFWSKCGSGFRSSFSCNLWRQIQFRTKMIADP